MAVRLTGSRSSCIDDRLPLRTGTDIRHRRVDFRFGAQATKRRGKADACLQAGRRFASMTDMGRVADAITPKPAVRFLELDLIV